MNHKLVERLNHDGWFIVILRIQWTARLANSSNAKHLPYQERKPTDVDNELATLNSIRIGDRESNLFSTWHRQLGDTGGNWLSIRYNLSVAVALGYRNDRVIDPDPFKAVLNLSQIVQWMIWVLKLTICHSPPKRTASECRFVWRIEVRLKFSPMTGMHWMRSDCKLWNSTFEQIARWFARMLWNLNWWSAVSVLLLASAVQKALNLMYRIKFNIEFKSCAYRFDALTIARAWSDYGALFWRTSDCEPF